MQQLTANALQILEQRYFLRNKDGSLKEGPEALFHRVASCIAAVETRERKYWEQVFYDLLNNLYFLPNSPTLMNAGLPDGQLSACFVLPVEDDLHEIFTTLTNASMIHKSGGGTGYNFSRLRARDSRLATSGGKASGPVSFMRIFDEATRQVKQGGKRRGANMGILNIDHPDIEEFIRVKSDGISLQNFNLSVGIFDDFMNQVLDDRLWGLRDPGSGKMVRQVPARKLWDAIVEMAWETGDPGLVFLDAINRANPLKKYSSISSTNPCGEVPLQDYESCNLGSVNLSKMLRKGENGQEVDWERLKSTVHHGIRFLDNVISANHYLLARIERVTCSNRKIGLGVMGWADMLLNLEIPYASEQAVEFAGDLMRFIRDESYTASEALAAEKGVFPSWEKSDYFPKRKMRNATCNSIAPTGSLAVIANTSYSIEPYYALSYTRKGILGDKSQEEVIPFLKEKLMAMGYWDERIDRMIWSTGSISDADWVPPEIRKLFQTSLEIGWEYHLRHQQAFQNFTDNAVSKTINLPEDAPVTDIDHIFRSAWKYGLKGITIYRDKSKTRQVLNRRCGIFPPTC